MHHKILCKMRISIGIVSLLLVSCIVDTSIPGIDDPLEFESVWQYLKAYSIYQDECRNGTGPNCVKKLADDPFSYSSPVQMMKLLYDTLKNGDNYTHYFSGEYDNTQAGSNNYTSTRLVNFYHLTKNTALLDIDAFSTGKTYLQLKGVLINFGTSYKNCIIDLRGNSGGDLEELDSIVELFLPAGKSYILVRQRKFDSTTQQFQTFDFDSLKTVRRANPYLEGKKYVVLMDSGVGGTASAAEIMASALKDCAGATLAGENSFGKAIGQIRLSRRGRLGLQITFMKLKSISLGDYHDVGLPPDVPISTNTNLSTDERKKEYLLKAIQIVEPQVTLLDVSYPSSLLKTKYVTRHPQGYRRVYE